MAALRATEKWRVERTAYDRSGYTQKYGINQRLVSIPEHCGDLFSPGIVATIHSHEARTPELSMLLIIPTIPVLHGECCDCISTSPNHTKDEEQRIYSSNPADRARLLRKENAKLLHLTFLDDDPWSDRSIEVIDDLRDAVDIPLELSLSSLPKSESSLGLVLAHGIYRLFFPQATDDSVLFDYAKRLGARRMVPTVSLSVDFEAKLPTYRAHGIERIGLEISLTDTLEHVVIDWPRLERLVACARENKVRVTVMHGVRNYEELRKLQDLGGPMDSLVLNRALNENRFPCQLIWRELEADFAAEQSPASNLWTNPLEGRPHI
jgi:phosphoribosylformimino-5-aminoimidazole carboxamide ribotide isomerase